MLEKFKQRVEALGSIKYAWDELCGEGAYAYLRFHAEAGDIEASEQVVLLHNMFGHINNERSIFSVEV